MERLKLTWRKTPRTARRVLVLIVGGLVILAGILMLVLPGPGWAAIFLGLAILSTEFERAEKIRSAIVRRFKDAIDKARAKSKR
ncbi:MAG TPA: PGPGW domain-containing protein [Candidatus Saccharimonadales bacterium]|nr:PGPGW domain-containing protein [Candidatus Saccharimonadales bacterium]